MAENSTSETKTHLDALAIENLKAKQLTGPENQDDLQLAAVRLVKQDRIIIQNNTALPSNEHYDELDGITEGQPEYPCSGRDDCVISYGLTFTLNSVVDVGGSCYAGTVNRGSR